MRDELAGAVAGTGVSMGSERGKDVTLNVLSVCWGDEAKRKNGSALM